MAPDRAGAPPRAWQRMLSGRRLDLLDPSPLDIEISDIAHGLARVARWNGQTRGDHAFSVAQHSLAVEALLGDRGRAAWAEAGRAALLQAAPKYVIGDMISPLKSVRGGSYKDCERRLQRATPLRFPLPAELGAGLRKEIKRADQIAAYYEATLLAGFSAREATEFFGRPRGFSAERFDFTPRSVTWAQAAFLERFAALEKSRLGVAIATQARE